MCCRTHTCRWSGWREQERRTATQKAEDQEVLFPLSSVRYAGCTAGESTGSRRVRLSEERHVAALCSPLTCSPQSSHIPVCPPTPPRAPCLRIRFFSWFQLLRVIKSDVLPLSDMSCKSTPIESHHFVTVCPVNRIFFVWTSVLWLCSWEPFWCPSPTGQRYAVICDCTGMNMRGWLSVSLCPVTDWWSV